MHGRYPGRAVPEGDGPGHRGTAALRRPAVMAAVLLLAPIPVCAAGGGFSIGRPTGPGLIQHPRRPPGIGMGVIEEDPAVTHEKWKEKAEEAYQDGLRARAAGKKADAVKFLMRAYQIGRRMRIDSEYPQKAADVLKELSEEGSRELQVARRMIASDAPAAGMLELKRITRVYLGLPPARMAGTQMRRLQRDERFQARLREAHLAEQVARAGALEARAATLRAAPDSRDPEGGAGADAARAAGSPAPADPSGAGLASAADADAGGADAASDAEESGRHGLPGQAPLPEGVGDAEVRDRPLTDAERRRRQLELLARAYDIYVRVAEDGAGTAVGKKARAARARLEKDAPLMARIRQARRQDRAREWLGLGLNYMRAGHMDKAREHFRKILDECPDTPQAREAKGYLDGMTK